MRIEFSSRFPNCYFWLPEQFVGRSSNAIALSFKQCLLSGARVSFLFCLVEGCLQPNRASAFHTGTVELGLRDAAHKLIDGSRLMAARLIVDGVMTYISGYLKH